MNAKKVIPLLVVIFIFLLSGCVAPSYYGGTGYSRAAGYYAGSGYYGGSRYYGGVSSGYRYRPSIYLNQGTLGDISISMVDIDILTTHTEVEAIEGIVIGTGKETIAAVTIIDENRYRNLPS